MLGVGNGGVSWAQQTVPSGIAAIVIASIPLWVVVLDRLAFGARLSGSRPSAWPSASPGWPSSSTPPRRTGSTRPAASPCSPRPSAGRAGRCSRAGAPDGAAARRRRDADAVRRRRLRRRGARRRRARGRAGAVLALGSRSRTSSSSARCSRSAPTPGCSGTPASLVATYAYVNPVVAVLLGAVFLGEAVTTRTLVAGAVIRRGRADRPRGTALAAAAVDPPCQLGCVPRVDRVRQRRFAVEVGAGGLERLPGATTELDGDDLVVSRGRSRPAARHR